MSADDIARIIEQALARRRSTEVAYLDSISCSGNAVQMQVYCDGHLFNVSVEED